jgi:hypothetical protein
MIRKGVKRFSDEIDAQSKETGRGNNEHIVYPAPDQNNFQDRQQKRGGEQ